MRTGALVSMMTAIAFSAPTLAQDRAPAGSPGRDLTLPPELRGESSAGRVEATPRPVKLHAQGAARIAAPKTGPEASAPTQPASAPAPHPIGFGMRVHGGADAHFYSATAAAQASQENGSGMTAGFKVGF